MHPDKYCLIIVFFDLKLRFYILALILVAVALVAQSSVAGYTGVSGRGISALLSDSDSVSTNLRIDSSLSVRDSLSDSMKLAKLDSIKGAFDQQHGIGNPKAVQWNDSIAQVQDSIRKSKKNALDDPVSYEAKDSVVFMAGDSYAFLYGDGKVNYQNIELTAEKMTMSLDSSIVHAVGLPDSTGTLVGKPVYKEGSEMYESETMSYNFKSKKGFITNVTTEQDGGFLVSQDAKKGQGDELYLKHGTYTTCDAKHPHFYIALSRAKVHTGKNVFAGPAWLVVEDVPLPLAVPFAYFPFTSKYSSGFIMPTYGDEYTRGFYLRDGGYYFAINDNVDLKLTGEIYTKGSWGISAQTTYKKRYKYSGNFYFNYQVTKTGEKNMPDYSVEKNFKVQWTHRQDALANPNSSFSASVNFATTSYEKNNLSSLYDPTSYSQSTRTSSVSYSYTFPRIGLSISSSANISQNMRDSTLALTLPDLSISLSRVYPFKRKIRAGKEKWYEKISLSYTGYLSNSISTKEDKLFHSSLIKDWRNGMKHYIPISASFSLFNCINITPSFNYTERWYTNRVEQSWDEMTQRVVNDTIYGFNRVYNYNLSLAANTALYGFYKPSKAVFGDKIEMIRHVFTPSVTFSYAPDFGAERYGFWKTYVKTDEDGNVSVVEYSPYSNSLYGVPSRGKTGSVSFDVSNNVEMKIKSDKDSTGVKKVSLIDELGASLSYNLAAKTKQWSDLSTRIRLKFGKSYTLNINARFATYAYEFDKNGNVVEGNRTEWSYGRFGRFQGMSKNISYTFNNNTFKTWKEKLNKLFGRGTAEDEDVEDEEGEDTENTDEESGSGKSKKKEREQAASGLDADGYMKFSMPWSFTVSYGLNMAEDRSADINIKTMRYPYKFTQTLNFSGNIRISNNWNINFSSGYDFTMRDLSMTTVNISRDMHCFTMSCGLVLGPFTSYNFSIRANASTLTDALKYDKRSSYSSTIKWY